MNSRVAWSPTVRLMLVLSSETLVTAMTLGGAGAGAGASLEPLHERNVRVRANVRRYLFMGQFSLLVRCGYSLSTVLARLRITHQLGGLDVCAYAHLCNNNCYGRTNRLAGSSYHRRWGSK